MNRLVPVNTPEDIFPEHHNTPVGLLLEYHNLYREYETYTQAQLLIGMCMDNRKHLHIPDNFAFIIRAGGNLKHPGKLYFLGAPTRRLTLTAS